jgi:hypothetical protein
MVRLYELTDGNVSCMVAMDMNCHLDNLNSPLQIEAVSEYFGEELNNVEYMQVYPNLKRAQEIRDICFDGAATVSLTLEQWSALLSSFKVKNVIISQSEY